MDKINEILEEVSRDNTSLVITIIVSLIVYIILTLTCAALYSFMCNRDDDEEEDQEREDVEENRRRSTKKSLKASTERDRSGDQAGQRIVDKFSVDLERQRIVASIQRKLRTQQTTFDIESPLAAYQPRESRAGLMRQPSIGSSQSSPALPVCTLCNQYFRLGENKVRTSCKHQFHQACLLKSINQQVEQSLRDLQAQTQQGKKVDLAKCSATCPTCGFHLDQAPPVAEQLAISQIGGILHMLSADEESAVDLGAIALSESGRTERRGDNENPVFESARDKSMAPPINTAEWGKNAGRQEA